MRSIPCAARGAAYSNFNALVLTAVGGILFSSANSYGVIIIDDFSAPTAPSAYVIDLINPDPYLLKTGSLAGILGGERDLLVDVMMDDPGPVSATGSVGGGLNGSYVFGTVRAGAKATLQYDGFDADQPDAPASLVNAQALPHINLAAGGNLGVRLDFASIEAGLGTALSVVIVVTSTSGSATFENGIPQNPSPTSYFVPFAAFTETALFTWADVTSLQFTFNGSGVPDVDFELDQIVADIPEPSIVALMAGGAVLGFRFRRRVRAAQ